MVKGNDSFHCDQIEMLVKNEDDGEIAASDSNDNWTFQKGTGIASMSNFGGKTQAISCKWRYTAIPYIDFSFFSSVLEGFNLIYKMY